MNGYFKFPSSALYQLSVTVHSCDEGVLEVIWEIPASSAKRKIAAEILDARIDSTFPVFSLLSSENPVGAINRFYSRSESKR